MKASLIAIFLLLTGLQFSHAQDPGIPSEDTTDLIISRASTEDPGFPAYQTGFYAGVRGGIVLKNKTFAEDPAYYLNNGMFAELHAGWRKKSFGWDLGIGMLNIKRDISPATPYAAPARNVLENLTDPSPFKFAIGAGEADGKYFYIPEPDNAVKVSKDFKGYYALTGPRVWIGKQKLQGSLYVHGGAISRTFGYYYISGNGTSSNSHTFTYNGTNVNDPKLPAASGTATVSIAGDYMQYGMSKELSDDFISSKAAAADLKEKNKIQFLGRAGASVELFLSQKASVAAGVDYWYIPMPEMAAASVSGGTLTGTTTSSSVSEEARWSDRYSYQKNFNTDKKNLGLLGAHLGLKLWFGGKKPTEQPAAPPPVVLPEEKNIAVKVIDKPTGKPLDGVTIKIEREDGDELIEVLTQEDGNIPLLKDVTPGNYKITGVKNGVNATEAVISIDDFSKASTVYRELIHNDLRFTLSGKTINKESATPIPFIQTSLANITRGAADQKTSDSVGRFFYQLEQNADYTVIAEHKGFFSNKEKVTTKGLNRSEVIYVNLALEVIELKKDASIVLKDIYYDYNSADIRTDAAVVLDDLVKMMSENPEIRIELSSHTDSRGGDAFNLDLSRKRAASAVRHLVSKGIAANRLEAKGYGETRLLNHCDNNASCSEEAHQVNRRTEIKILE